jgi:hypothetical protein
VAEGRTRCPGVTTILIGGQRLRTAEERIKPFMLPGISMSVNITWIWSSLFRTAMASSALSAAITSNPSSSSDSTRSMRIKYSSSTTRTLIFANSNPRHRTLGNAQRCVWLHVGVLEKCDQLAGSSSAAEGSKVLPHNHSQAYRFKSFSPRTKLPPGGLSLCAAAVSQLLRRHDLRGCRSYRS